jgi:DNA-directed RNA polymerase subunit beta'
MGLLLDMSPKALEQVLYFSSFVVLNPGTTPLAVKQILNDKEYIEAQEKYGAKSFKVGMGAEAIKELLMNVDLEKESKAVKEIIESSTGQKKLRAIKRIEIIEAFRRSGNDPKWMILDVLPVIPPELRPMVQLDGGRFATSDLNDLYRRVINRNNRLKRLMELGAPDIIVRNEKRMLQEAVDALIDNGRRGKPVSGAGNRELKSLSAMLRGKQGRFRQNLLGKRVDYSGRSVIVVGPELKLYQCGLPKEMALELFKPFVMKKLVELNHSHNIKSAKRKVERADAKVWDVLEDVIKDHPVLLNRAPTLHRLSIQAFEPVLIEGRALKIHPLVCGAFNADFDGDQMAVHVPLSVEAQTEARFLLLASNNILKLSDGKPVVSPTQDMVIGCYYLTIDRSEEDGAKGTGRYFADADEAFMAYELGEIGLQTMVNIRVSKEIDGKKYTTRLHTSIGRVIFNDAIPQDLGFCKRETPEDMLKLEIDYLVGKKQLSQIVEACFKQKGSTATAEVLDKIKVLGFKYSTIGAVTASIFDMHIPAEKPALLQNAERKVIEVERQYKRGLITDDERYKEVVRTWTETTDQVTEALKKTLTKFNPIWMMANSGARGNMNQIRQLSGMRGLMSNPSGKIIELPVRACFREGLTVLEYFISSHGGRKGLADTALKTADSGYLTRRLVDVSHEVIVREDDCCAGSKPAGITIGALTGDKKEEVIESLRDRLAGRFCTEKIVHPKTKEVLATPDKIITDEVASAIEKAGIEEVSIRSVLTCKSKYGICAKCYGKNMATGTETIIGEAVGIIAAQSIGEPGTQLTMRTFHTGGVATSDDITQGLPRIEELFEARKPKGLALISEVSGRVKIYNSEARKEIVIKQSGGEEKTYPIPFNSRLRAKDNEIVEPGSVLTEGSINPHDILKTKGPKSVQEYLLKEVQYVYRMQGVEINDKHVEVIIKQMLRKVRVEDVGDTNMLAGELVDIFKFDEENSAVLENGGRPAAAKRTLLGITKAALATDSFLSAASFQETARVLTEAAIKNKIDPLLGLKENVIIGKLIPAGTGMKMYRGISTNAATAEVVSNIVNGGA